MSSTSVGTTGVFDLFHVGHLDLIERAAALGDHLVVVMASDDLAEALGLGRPIVPFDERRAIVEAVAVVGSVVELHDVDLARALAGAGIGLEDLVVSHELDCPGTSEVYAAASAVGAAVTALGPLVRTRSEMLAGTVGMGDAQDGAEDGTEVAS